MKSLLLLLACVIIAFGAHAQQKLVQKHTFTTKYLDINSDKYLTKKEFVNQIGEQGFYNLLYAAYQKKEITDSDLNLILSNDELKIKSQITKGIDEDKNDNGDNVVKHFIYDGGDFFVPLSDGKAVFVNIYEANDDALTLYNKSRLCVADMFRSARHVTQYDDKDTRTIVVKGLMEWVKDSESIITKGFNVYFTLKIECKNGKYRMSVYDFISSNSAGGVTITCTEKECLDAGIKPDGKIKNNLFGLSWLAWYETANKLFKIISDKMNQSSIDDDW